MYVIAKDMTEVGIDFEVLRYRKVAPIVWKKVTGHLVWDVNIILTHKLWWVLDGHKTPDPIGSNYAGFVSRGSAHISFTYATLNRLNVLASDIRYSYLQAPSSFKDYIICGDEFGIENVGNIALIHRELYGGKTAGRYFSNHLHSCMIYLNSISFPADPDIWMRYSKRRDGSEFYD